MWGEAIYTVIAFQVPDDAKVPVKMFPVSAAEYMLENYPDVEAMMNNLYGSSNSLGNVLVGRGTS